MACGSGSGATATRRSKGGKWEGAAEGCRLKQHGRIQSASCINNNSRSRHISLHSPPQILLLLLLQWVPSLADVSRLCVYVHYYNNFPCQHLCAQEAAPQESVGGWVVPQNKPWIKYQYGMKRESIIHSSGCGEFCALSSTEHLVRNNRAVIGPYE